MATKGRSKVRKQKKTMKAPMLLQDTAFCQGFGSVAEGSYGHFYINAAHIMSMMNRKSFHQVTADGHVKNYGLSIQVFNMTQASTSVYTASQGYPMENAVRAWHFARKERLNEAGFKLSDLGYGSRLRFALDETMVGIDQSTSYLMAHPEYLANTIADQGEWDFSDVIITPPVNMIYDAGLETLDMIDGFKLFLCGDHVIDASSSETIKYESVGMIQSWTENTRGWAEPDAEEVIQPQNPLAFARASDASSYLLTTEVADEQKQAPPYSNAENTAGVSSLSNLVLQGALETAYPNQTTNNVIIIAPGGLAKISIHNQHSAGQTPWVSIRIIEL